ncbi:M56 family metallopeptidase [Prauserella cavernicola]|uniref:M56 family metallopeptidase n=1 Tax=Prauserella cavernicola TaxID=2800127 RepID=A0A934V1U0_9PSEU|nr:M56 family metallopeptidase [Prauserella cavernicola]MBK1783896.1 M56 family metallopeptidase [Prauserella cavernicola]
MAISVALLVGSLLCGWLLPRALGRLDVRRRDPLPLLIGWLVSMAGVLVAATTGLVLQLLPGHGVGGWAIELVVDCWSALHHGPAPRAELWVGLLGLVVGGVAAVRLALVGGRRFSDLARETRRHRSTLRSVGRRADSTPETLWLAHDRPLAFSLGGRRGLIVATEGLTRALPPAQVDAVLEHERAHLRGRHHLLIAAADALRTVFPFVPLYAHAPHALRELAELAADSAAARRHGTGTVHSALTGVARHTVPRAALGMAADAITVRMERLRHGDTGPRRSRRALACGLAATSGLLLPFLTAFALFLGLAFTVCPLPGW